MSSERFLSSEEALTLTRDPATSMESLATLRRRVIARNDDLDQALVAHLTPAPETLVTLLSLPGALERPHLRLWLLEDQGRVEDLSAVTVAPALRAERVPD
jgi:hypothetical protein